MCHVILERLLVRFNGGGKWQTRQVHQVVGPERRPEAPVAEALEFLLVGGADIPLKDVVPLLGYARHVEVGEPNSIDRARLLSAEELLASIDPTQQVVFAIVGRERKLVVAWNTSARQLRRVVGKRRRHVHGCGGWRVGDMHHLRERMALVMVSAERASE